MGGVVSLGGTELFGEAGDENGVTVLVQLVEGCAKSELACVKKIW